MITGNSFGFVCLAAGVVLLSACSKQPSASQSLAARTDTAALRAAWTSEQTKTKAAPSWAAKKYGYKPSRDKQWDILHTKLELSFDWSKKHVLGEATLTIKPYFYPQQKLELDAVGFEIHGVELRMSKAKPKPLKFDYNGQILTLSFDSAIQASKTLTLAIDYTAKPDENPTGGSAAITSDKGLYFINADGKDTSLPKQIWTQGETQANSRWFPTIDSPNEKSTQEMVITVDTMYKSLSNGLLTSTTLNRDGTRTDVWEMKQPHSVYLFMMAIGKFVVTKDKWRNVPVNYWLEPKFAPYAKAIFKNTPEMIEFFSQKTGVPYPWPKYDQVVVRQFVSGAMENTSATIHYDAVQKDDRALIDQNEDQIIAHELFHHWFGDLVTAESWANLPLNESFANYSEYLWDEHKYGREEADYNGLKERNQYLSESGYKQEPLIRYFYKDKEEMFDSHSYAKGGRILHMLRYVVGDKAFFESLKLYLTRHAYKNAEIHDLRLAFEEVTGQDMNWFFNQWFMSAGHPRLDIKHSWQAGKLSVSITQQQDSAYTPIYKIPTSLDVWTAQGYRRLPITISKQAQTFEFDLASAPQAVLFDGDQCLLSVVSHPKSEVELAEQYKQSKLFKPRYDAVMNVCKPEWSTIGQELLQKALSDPFWGIRRIALQRIGQFDSTKRALFFPTIAKIAESDPKSLVQAEAIELLPKDPAYNAIYKKAMGARSYAVSGAGLTQYSKTGARDLKDYIPAFKKVKNAAIIDALGQYYVNSNDPEGLSWFQQTLATESDITKYSLYAVYGQYLSKADKVARLGALPKVQQEATNASAWYVRLAAFQALALQADLPGVTDTLNKLAKEEKEERLRNAYESMGFGR